MNPDVAAISVALILVTLAITYYARVELPLREEDGVRQMLRAFSKAIELRFPNQAGLSGRVAALSVFVGQEMGLSPRRLRELERAAWLRDLGLCGISYQLINKKARRNWTPADEATYKRHPEVGGAMLELVPNLRSLAMIVRCHEANFDGSSGPYFPHGTDLPIEARILKLIADYVSAEKRLGQLLAREQLRDGAGKAYDPEIVRAFVGVLTSTRVGEPTEPILA